MFILCPHDLDDKPFKNINHFFRYIKTPKHSFFY